MCSTWRGRLSIRQQIPNIISSRLVRMKARMALVTFWILPSLLGPLAKTHSWFNGKPKIPTSPQLWINVTDARCTSSLCQSCPPHYTPSSSSPWCIQWADTWPGTAAAGCRTWTRRNSLRREAEGKTQEKSNNPHTLFKWHQMTSLTFLFCFDDQLLWCWNIKTHLLTTNGSTVNNWIYGSRKRQLRV